MSRDTNVFGVDPSDPNGKDDIQTLNEIHVPVNKPVIVYVSSKDVIHSFKVVAMRVARMRYPACGFLAGSHPRRSAVIRSTARSSAVAAIQP